MKELTEYNFYEKVPVDNEIALLKQSRDFWKKEAKIWKDRFLDTQEDKKVKNEIW